MTKNASIITITPTNNTSANNQELVLYRDSDLPYPDPKDDDEYEESFQRSRRIRILVIMAAALLVVGAAIAITFAAIPTSDASQSSGLASTTVAPITLTTTTAPVVPAELLVGGTLPDELVTVETPTSTPDATPQVTTATPEPTTVTPEPTTVTSEPTTVTPEPTTVTSEPTTVTPQPTTTTAAPTDAPIIGKPESAPAPPALGHAPPAPAPAPPAPAPAPPAPAPPAPAPAPPAPAPAPPAPAPAPPAQAPAPPAQAPAPPAPAPAPPAPAPGPSPIGPSTYRVVNGCNKNQDMHWRSTDLVDHSRNLGPYESLDLNALDYGPGKNIMIRATANNDATLFEGYFDPSFNVVPGAGGTIWYDISVIPNDCGTSWSHCSGSGVGYNAPLTVEVVGKLQAKCENLVCNQPRCPAGYHVPDDNLKVKSCEKKTSFILTFGCATR